MSSCSQCGTSLDEIARFCPSCGAAAAAAPSQPCQPAAAPSGNEKVLIMLPQAKKMKMMGLFDSYTVAFTAERALFARLSGDVLKDVVKKSQEQSKAEGKGMFARVGSQMKAFRNAHLRYLEMSPAAILAEDKNNFALPHASVSSLKIKRRLSPGDEDGPGDPYLELEWEASSGKYKFRVDMEEKDALEILNQFYGGKIRR